MKPPVALFFPGLPPQSSQLFFVRDRDRSDKYYTAILDQESKINQLKAKIKEISAEERYAEKVSKVRCFKGIDTLTALIFVTEIGDFRRFRKAFKFMAYMGLVSSVYSSGEKRKIGGITKAGNSRLRKLLTEGL